MSLSKWLSRKFIVAAVAQLAGIAMLIWPSQGDVIAGLAQSVAALVVVVLAALGYVKTEGQLDWQALQNKVRDQIEG
jgi:drug/metabolite transporter (DMT)-like permease